MATEVFSQAAPSQYSNISFWMHFQPCSLHLFSTEYVQQHKQLERINKRRYWWQKPFSWPFSSALSTPVYIGQFFLVSFYFIKTFPWSFGVWKSFTLFPFHLITTSFYTTNHLFPSHTYNCCYLRGSNAAPVVFFI